jgi:type II secretory pathway pseudopilin PulG
MKQSHRNRTHGFLLIEAMIASVILSVAVVVVVDLLLTSQQQQAAIQQNSTALLLARQLMEEIAAKPFGSSTQTYPPSQRALMTTANQYNGYSDSTTEVGNAGAVGIQTQGLPQTTIEPGGGETYQRTVTVQSPPASIDSSDAAPAGDLLIVTVTVTTPSNQKVTLTRLLTNVTWIN